MDKERLYWQESYLTEFGARITRIVKKQNYIEVVLDRTAFCPTSEGQMNDVGCLAKSDVF